MDGHKILHRSKELTEKKHRSKILSK